MSEPEPILCICCPVLWPGDDPHRPNYPPVCDSCRKKLASQLVELPTLYHALEEHLEPGRGVGEIRAKGFESRLPAAVDPLSMLGPGSMIPATEGSAWVRDQLGDTPPLDRLWWWAEEWAQILRWPMPAAQIGPLCAWLADRLGWACDQHPAVDEFAADLRRITGAIKAVTGGDRGEKVGRCPRTLTDGSRCDTQLYVDPYVDKIVCSRCHMEWNRRDGQWLHLRGQQLAAGVEAA